MGTYWHKQGWLKGELDEVTGQPVPGAMPPGLYCEDEAAFRAVEKAAAVRRFENGFTQRGDDPTWRPHLTVGGTIVRVATPAEAEILRAIAPSATDPDKVERLVEARARHHEIEMDAAMRRLFVGRLLADTYGDLGALRTVEDHDTIDRLPARNGASQTLTSGTVNVRCTQRSKPWKGPHNLAPVTGPNRQARRAAAAHARRA